ncbi:MAG: site-2 protease family protein, partial [Nannocystaceae bacterium]
MDWLYAILALSALIIIHEFGHYICARIGGMHVDTFSVLGIGPVVAELFEYKGTRFVLSAIPFGAYVHIVGMEPEDDEDDPKLSPEDQRAIRVEKAAAAARAKEMGYEDYRDRPLWARALALFGGPGANYIAAMAIAAGVFLGFGMPTQVEITSFGEGSGAQAAGFQAGDAFVRIGEMEVTGASPSLRLNDATSKYRGETVDVTVMRDGAEVTAPVMLATDGPALGVNLGVNFVRGSAAAAITQGLRYPFVQTKIQLKGL